MSKTPFSIFPLRLSKQTCCCKIPRLKKKKKHFFLLSYSQSFCFFNKKENTELGNMLCFRRRPRKNKEKELTGFVFGFIMSRAYGKRERKLATKIERSFTVALLWVRWKSRSLERLCLDLYTRSIHS